MCGIFGMIISPDVVITKSTTRRIMDRLYRLSESRGKEASGVSLLTEDAITIAKYARPAHELINLPEYRKILDLACGRDEAGSKPGRFPLCLLGHSRLVTNGSQQNHQNNQPVISSGMAAIHNGIITNDDLLWRRHGELERDTQLDTEILLKLIRQNLKESGSLKAAVRRAYREIEGVASIAVLFTDLNAILLASNNGSLHFCRDLTGKVMLFASEKHILQTLLRDPAIHGMGFTFIIEHIQAGEAVKIDLATLKAGKFQLAVDEEDRDGDPCLSQPRRMVDISPAEETGIKNAHIAGEGPYILPTTFVDAFPKTADAVARLRRCTRCILPETMPFIEFDAEGVCNYCHNDFPHQVLGADALFERMAGFRKTNGDPDCLVTFSGGRDSSYGLHYVKTVLKMKPITYTYDWGMVTDLARRNQMRLCGKLGVEHILISADLAAKRGNIRKNVSAWLRRPDLGTIPLFMAGDKQYFYYANKVGEQTGCEVIILCENPMETTRFKLGFCGVPPLFSKLQSFNLPLSNRVKLVNYYARQYLRNPAYLNSSLVDTAGAYLSYYFIPHNYINLYDYIHWDEKIINETLLGEYNWETATDTKSTWRIGDGTASFYNYIYYTMAGLTENDTFRSNQIRAGLISREEALRSVMTENLPRYESIQWYCDIVGIDFETTIDIINHAPKRFEVE